MPDFNQLKSAYETKVVSENVDTNKDQIIDKKEIPILKEKLNNSNEKLEQLNISMKEGLLPALKQISGKEGRDAENLIIKVTETVNNITAYLWWNTNTENGNNNSWNQQWGNHNNWNNHNWPWWNPLPSQSWPIPEWVNITTSYQKTWKWTWNINIGTVFWNTRDDGTKIWFSVNPQFKTNQSNTSQLWEQHNTLNNQNTWSNNDSKVDLSWISAGFTIDTSRKTKKVKETIKRQWEVDTEKVIAWDKIKDKQTALDLENAQNLWEQLGEAEWKLKIVNLKIQKYEKKIKEWNISPEEEQKYLALSKEKWWYEQKINIIKQKLGN